MIVVSVYAGYWYGKKSTLAEQYERTTPSPESKETRTQVDQSPKQPTEKPDEPVQKVIQNKEISIPGSWQEFDLDVGVKISLPDSFELIDERDSGKCSFRFQSLPVPHEKTYRLEIANYDGGSRRENYVEGQGFRLSDTLEFDSKESVSSTMKINRVDEVKINGKDYLEIYAIYASNTGSIWRRFGTFIPHGDKGAIFNLLLGPSEWDEGKKEYKQEFEMDTKDKDQWETILSSITLTEPSLSDCK